MPVRKPSLLYPRWLSNLPINYKLSLIIIMMAITLGVALLNLWFGLSTISSLRAYVGGEGLWSKAQKEALHGLHAYVRSHNEQEYQNFLKAIEVNLGDRTARLQLIKDHPDYTLARDGFLKGRNHPDDIPGMITLFRRFYWAPYIKRANAIWTQADIIIFDLENIAAELHRSITAGQLSPQRSAEISTKLNEMEQELTRLADHFSYTLGEASRWAQSFILGLTIFMTLAIGSIGLLIAFIISRTISRNILAIQHATVEFAKGDFNIRVRSDAKDELGQLANAFNTMGERLQESERLKSEFLANVSHELRTPLTLILSPIESLLAGDLGAIAPSQRQTLQTSHNNAVRLLQMVNGLLDFSKLEAGKLELHQEATDVIQLSRAILFDFKSLAENKGITLYGCLPVDPISVRIDRYIYERILFNLLSNAIKFTPAKGKVTLEVIIQGNDLHISVTDTGVGIAEDQLSHLFKRFHQAEGSATRRFEGTGLGLALVKEFVTLMQGEVTAKSEPGKGSIFTVIFPILPSSPTDFVAPVARKPLLIQKYDGQTPKANKSSHIETPPLPKVVLAEDNTELAAHIVTLLNHLAQIRTAHNGQEALQIVREWMPDLVISDVMMPEKDGLSLCRDIKTDARTSLIPVVLLTALTHRDALLKGWEAGADEYLYKPFHPKELITRIQSLLSITVQRRRAEELFHLSQVKSEFTTIVSHELRTPLCAIKESIQIILDEIDGPLAQAQQETLRVAQRNVDRLDRLINNVLDISKIESGKMTLTITPTNFNDLLTEVYHLMKSIATKKEIAFSMYLPQEQIVTACDTDKVKQVLINLLDNALKFTPAKGTVSLRLFSFDDELHIEVRDTGIGIKPEDQDKIFDMFTQVINIGTRKMGGVGIGLSLCRQLLKLQGGDIFLESDYGKGSRFLVTLPYRK